MSETPFPPAPTPADMSMLLHGLSAVYTQISTINEHLGKLEASLDALGTRMDGIEQPAPAPAPVADPLEAYVTEVAAFRAGLVATPNSPQVHEGLNTLKPPTGADVGRVAANQNRFERFVVSSSAAFREAAKIKYTEIANSPPNNFQDDTHDLGTGFTHDSHPASVFASDTMSLAAVPTSGTGAPPSGVFIRYYKLECTTATNPPEVVDGGRCYREWHVNAQGREVWVDHWVFFPDYQAPAMDGAGTTLSVEKQSTGIPTSADDFFDQMQAIIEADTEHIADDYKYGMMTLVWQEFHEPA